MSTEQVTDQSPEKRQPKTQWLIFQCPVCNTRMYAHAFEAVYNDRVGQQYIQTKCRCLDCDIHITSRVPRKIAATIVDDLPPPVDESKGNER